MVSSDESLLCQPCAPDEEDVDLKSALFKDPIVGHGPVLIDENGCGALDPKPLSTPPSMTPLAEGNP